MKPIYRTWLSLPTTRAAGRRRRDVAGCWVPALPQGSVVGPPTPPSSVSLSKRGNRGHLPAGRFPACERPSGSVRRGSECHSYESLETQGVKIVSSVWVVNTQKIAPASNARQGVISGIARGRKPDPASRLLPWAHSNFHAVNAASREQGCLLCLFFVCVLFIIFIGI